MRSTRQGARVLTALVVAATMLGTLVGSGRADPGEEPNLTVEIVGLKPDSKRDVVIRVSNVSEQWSDVTKLTVETVSPTAGQRRTFDVQDINTVAEAPLPNSFEFTYTLAADCTNQVVKASLTAGKNYMGEQELNLDDNVVQGAACAAPGQAAQGQGLAANAPAKPAPILNNKPAAANEPLFSIEWTAGPKELFFTTIAVPYEIRIRNNQTDRASLELEIEVDGDATISQPQPSGSYQDWKNLGFDCRLWEPGGAWGKHVEWECGVGSIKPGTSVTLRFFVKMTAQAGEFTLTAEVRPGFGAPNIENARTVKIVKI